MSKKSKSNKSAKELPVSEEPKGMQALAALLETTPEQEALDAASLALQNDPAYPVFTEAVEKLEEANRLEGVARDLEAKMEQRIKKVMDIVPTTTRLQGLLEALRRNIRKGILSDNGITNERAVSMFTSRLEKAVDAGVRADSRGASWQDELARLVAEAEGIRIANLRAPGQIAETRGLAERLTKEANELLASIEGGV